MAERKRAKTSGTPASIREALKKATTEMLVLFVLRQKKMYTYEMMQEISHMSDGKIAFNTLYQAIYRLQSFQYIKEDGKVVSDDNRIRIYFTITPSGEEYLDKLMEEYHSFTGAVDHVLSQTDVLRGKYFSLLPPCALANPSNIGCCNLELQQPFSVFRRLPQRR